MLWIIPGDIDVFKRPTLYRKFKKKKFFIKGIFFIFLRIYIKDDLHIFYQNPPLLRIDFLRYNKCLKWKSFRQLEEECLSWDPVFFLNTISFIGKIA